MSAGEEIDEEASAPRPGIRIGWFIDRRWSALLALLPMLALAFLNDPGGYLGTDTGGKTATLEAMVQRGDWSPNVGYWAEAHDPEGLFHPQFGTTRAEAGWVQVTSLPMIYAARPLWAVGGYRAVLLLPMAGTIAAALAAASLVQRLRGELAAPLAFWLLALGSPLLVYALDFWEHSVGVAAIGWAVVLAYDHVVGRRPWPVLIGAGALLGFAATMRTEALVYTLVVVATVCLCQLRSSITGPVRSGAAAVAGFAMVWSANLALEELVGSVTRTGRATGTASSAGDQAGARIEEGMRTTFATMATSSWAPVVVGVLLTVGVTAAVAWGHRIPPARSRFAVVGLLAGTLLTVLPGLGFVSGLFPAFPVAAAALAVGRLPLGARPFVYSALAALPLVWAFQYLGGAGPQWGGRYTLPSAYALGVVGVVAITNERVPRAVAGTVLAMCVAVTSLGVGWLWERSHEIVDVFDAVGEVEVEALIARNVFFLRESGPRALHQRWLSARDPDDLDPPAAVLRRAGISEFGVFQVAGDPEPRIDGAEVTGAIQIPAFGGAFEVVQLRFAG